VNFAVIMLPILVYSVMNLTFQDEVFEDWGSLWVVGLFFNIIFVSVLTIACSVILMLRLLPNREVTEPEYLAIIERRLAQIGQPNIRVRWMETEMKNAFVMGLKLLRFSNQTMFVGRRFRKLLTLEEFDAVICHELGHVANRHIQRRVIQLLKNLLTMTLGLVPLFLFTFGASALFWGEDAGFHLETTATVALLFGGAWVLLNYGLLFDSMRSHEYEADAYAVLVLGASPEAMKSALRKLSEPDELPEYLRERQRQGKEKHVIARVLGRFISTHPSLEERISSLELKLAFNLPYNHYVSGLGRLARRINEGLSWKTLAPVTVASLALVGWGYHGYRQGQEMIGFIERASSQEILARDDLRASINSRPHLMAPSLLHYVVQKRDTALIDHFVQHGARKGRLLRYLAEARELELFRKYYDEFEQELTRDEYYFLLRQTAQLRFTEGYRFLVNAERFNEVEAGQREELAELHKQRATRRPASK
jgi:Zn-dependent protease with chaperone function